MYDEVHALRDTATSKDCWVGVTHRPDRIICAIHATSKATGWDLPLTYDHVLKADAPRR